MNRRWDDVDGRGLFDRVRRCLSAALPFLAAVVLAGFVAVMIYVIGSVRESRDQYRGLANRAETTAADAKTAAADAKTAAGAAKRASEDNNRLLLRSDPCLPGDPPDSERCVRKAAGEKALAGALNAIANENIHQHQALLDRLIDVLNQVVKGLGHSTIVRVEALPPAGAPSPAPNPIPTTTTTCPQLGNSGRCRGA